MINIDLGDLHLEVVGQEADGFPHSSQAGAARWLEQAGRGPWGQQGDMSEMPLCTAAAQVCSSGLKQRSEAANGSVPSGSAFQLLGTYR